MLFSVERYGHGHAGNALGLHDRPDGVVNNRLDGLVRPGRGNTMAGAEYRHASRENLQSGRIYLVRHCFNSIIFRGVNRYTPSGFSSRSVVGRAKSMQFGECPQTTIIRMSH
jgi:hypothetical protein